MLGTEFALRHAPIGLVAAMLAMQWSLRNQRPTLEAQGLFARSGAATEPRGTYGFAIYDREERYRYLLGRLWAGATATAGVANFVMLNPSTATEMVLDPTLRRCMGFAKAWGCSGMVVTNLFAYRATDPRALRALAESAGDPVGAHNDHWIVRAALRASIVVAGWGAHGGLKRRGDVVADLLTRRHDVHALRLTQWGYPSHPLYLPAECKPVLWRRKAASDGGEENAGVDPEGSRADRREDSGPVGEAAPDH